MIQITPQMRILVAIEPVDFRKGIDGIARICQEALRQDPFCGAVFVFRNRRATALKVYGHPSDRGGQDTGGASVAGSSLGGQSRNRGGGAPVAAGRPGELTRRWEALARNWSCIPGGRRGM
jgi:hypothetical protein